MIEVSHILDVPRDATRSCFVSSVPPPARPAHHVDDTFQALSPPALLFQHIVYTYPTLLILISTLHLRTGASISPSISSGCPLTSARLFRFKNPKEPLLLLYKDEPCVVIGRNQNPWKEVNLPALREMEIPWIRRRSGGGTVYHVCRLLHCSLYVLTYAIGYWQHKLLHTLAAYVI